MSTLDRASKIEFRLEVSESRTACVLRNRERSVTLVQGPHDVPDQRTQTSALPTREAQIDISKVGSSPFSVVLVSGKAIGHIRRDAAKNFNDCGIVPLHCACAATPVKGMTCQNSSVPLLRYVFRRDIRQAHPSAAVIGVTFRFSHVRMPEDGVLIVPEDCWRAAGASLAE